MFILFITKVKMKFLGPFSNFYIYRLISNPLTKRIREKKNKLKRNLVRFIDRENNIDSKISEIIL